MLLSVSSYLVGCGETSRAGGESGSRDIPNVVLIDNGEDGDNVTLDDEAGYIGFWYTFDDRCECDNENPEGETTPTPDPLGGGKFGMTSYASAGVMPPPLAGEQSENRFGVRVRGGGHTAFGAGVGVGLNNQSGALGGFDLDALGATHLRFDARSGAGETLSMKTRISDVYSEPAGGSCAPRPDVQDRCDKDWDMVSCDIQGCFDSPTTAYFDITDQWKTYTIPLTELQREGWGVYREGVQPPATDLATNAAYQIQFAVPQDLTQFDLWIDNVGFVLDSAGPTGG